MSLTQTDLDSGEDKPGHGAHGPKKHGGPHKRGGHNGPPGGAKQGGPPG